MFTFLHHSDPTIPHYRKSAWSFLRGAAATVDRPLLGWMGRFFFHNISHDHVAHRMSLSNDISDTHFYIIFLTYRFLFESAFLWVYSPNVHRLICGLTFFLSVDNGPEITKVIKSVLKDDYNYDSTVSPLTRHLSSLNALNFVLILYKLFAFSFSQPSFYALYRSFTECQFIEEEGDIIFYKNRKGEAVRSLHPSVVEAKENQDSAEMKLEFGNGVSEEVEGN